MLSLNRMPEFDVSITRTTSLPKLKIVLVQLLVDVAQARLPQCICKLNVAVLFTDARLESCRVEVLSCVISQGEQNLAQRM